jgi:hypothetical protein
VGKLSEAVLSVGIPSIPEQEMEDAMTAVPRILCSAIVLAGLATACSSSSKTTASNSGPTPSATSGEGASSTTTQPSAKPHKSRFLYFSAPVAFPAGPPDKLSIVEQGPPLTGAGSTTVHVVIRNNTSEAVVQVKVSGTARRGGALVGSGESQGMAPERVEPGEFTLGYVFFQNAVPAGATFDLTVTGTPVSEATFANSADVLISEVNRQPPAEFGNESVVGIVKNPTSKIVHGPVSVDVTCFVGAKPISQSGGFTNADSIAPNGTASFEISLPDGACPVFAVGASGYTS